MGGQVTLVASSEQGSHFRLLLPQVAIEQGEQAQVRA